MNDQNQNQPKPDYGFILNQQVPAAETKREKKVLVLFFACIVLVVVAGAAFVLNSATSKVATNSTTSAQIAPQTHIKELAAGNTTAAYGELSAETQKQYSQADYSKNVVDVLTNSIDLTTCKASTTKQATDAQYFNCNTRNKQLVVTLKVVTTTENSKTKIVQYLVVAAEKVT